MPLSAQFIVTCLITSSEVLGCTDRLELSHKYFLTKTLRIEFSANWADASFSSLSLLQQSVQLLLYKQLSQPLSQHRVLTCRLVTSSLVAGVLDTLCTQS